ncbi:RNase H domain-containing protein [Trichonephila clavipes]|uniref:RNase H domain-containing protein n=1 Tax=Trichonephila clavipes TaxID=2585209 RepID=A0A8X7BHW9_TRICX|nr:RNase H domain-containing protein [Trichonephila clavipes]
MSKISPFAILKTLIGIGEEPKSVKRLRSGDLLIETMSDLQTKSFLLAKTFFNSPVTVSPHKTLNSCRGVISEPDLLSTPDAEILEGFSDQGVIQPLPESNPTASNGEHFNAPEVPQCAKRNSRNRRKRPKVQEAEIKIQMAPHRPRKSTPTESTTDEEDMIMYDVQAEELEPNPEDKFAVMECFVNNPSESWAKSATTHLPLAVPLSDMKRVIMHHIFKIWQESWSQQLDNKLHSVKPVIGAWPVVPLRRTDVKLTRLRIGHTRFTHRHLLFGERAPECPSCHVSYTVHHILIDCPVFNNYRITFFNSSHLTLPDLVGEIPHQNLFAFIRRIGFLYLI